jgi:hypothetical protein
MPGMPGMPPYIICRAQRSQTAPTARSDPLWNIIRATPGRWPQMLQTGTDS